MMRGYNLKNGCLVVKVKYLKQKPSGLYYFRRGIPEKLREFYSGKRELIHSLQTQDEKLAVKKCQILAVHYDREFKSLRTSGDRTRAEALIQSYGMEATDLANQSNQDLSNDGHPYNQLIEDLSLKYDMGERKAPTSHEQRALDILHGEERVTLAEIEKDTLKSIVVKGNRSLTLKKKEQEITRHFQHFSSRLPVSEIHLIRRRMVQKAVDDMADSGLKTGTIKRVLATVRVNVKKAIIRHELNIINPFSDIEIRGLGLDVTSKKTFSQDQLAEVKAFITEKSDLPTAQVLGLLVESGGRCGEVGGLMLEDIYTDGKTPHMVLRQAENRGLKTASSQRRIPLVGLSLEIATQLKTNASKEQVYAFPNWNLNSEYNHNKCSNAVNKFLQSRFSGYSTHCFRHTMVDRLKSANIRGDYIDAICGWSDGSMKNHYGQSDMLEILHSKLLKVLEKEQG